ncbi:MAG: hypothetical protein KDK78_04445, partial [Chlamydiia bacterium]|nr:hypothetical protein [Chlamydiia bacterium]
MTLEECCMRDRLAHWIDHIEERSGRYALALIGLTMLVGIVYSLLLGDHLRYFDEEAYFSLARTLVEEGRFSRDGIYLSSHRPPGYSAILAAGYALGMRVVGLRILNFLALAATMGLGYWMLRRFSRFGAVLVCVLP